ncbi:MAG TPA: transporter [Hanamia sp.]|nr:transporter [Hanamia sp.]
MKTWLLIFLFLFTSFAHAQTLQDSVKLRYNLFHPTPKNLMRDFETDRPDVTESAYTVDAGHFQLETDLIKTERFNTGGIHIINNFFNTVNLKLGITNSLDFQVVVATINTSRVKEENTSVKQSGFGGLTLRVKQNLWGNDNGKTALSLLPFVTIPTSSAEKISGGIVFPFATLLSHGWDFGAEIEADITPNQTGNNYHFNYLVSATTSHSLFKNLDFFVEGVATRDNESKIYEYFIDGGPIFSVTKNWNIDCGVYYGLKRISSKTFFVGMSLRI